MGNLYDGLSISVSYGCTLINTNQPLDIRTVVNSYSDIASIPNPYIGMTITVKIDETNDNKMTDYKVKSLKSNELGMNNTVIDAIERLDVYVGIDEIKTQLDAKENYITYEEFGAKCDGVYDDGIAIKLAHEYANLRNLR